MKHRTRLPECRNSILHTVQIGGTVLTFNVGLYADGSIGEIFIHEIEGTDNSPALMGSLDAFATAVSLLLQIGYPVDDLVKKFIDSAWEPSGFTDNPDIHSAKSYVDYIVKWMYKYTHKENTCQIPAT